MTERVTFDVFITEFEETMAYSFEQYLRGLHACQTPEEIFMQHTEFVLFTSRVYAQLEEVADSAETATASDYH